jgi:hypothetical protein
MIGLTQLGEDMARFQFYNFFDSCYDVTVLAQGGDDNEP